MGKRNQLAVILLTAIMPVCFAGVVNTNAQTGEDSFAQIEALDQHVEQANKQIDALKVSQQLKDLQDKANRMSMDFQVLRIQGVDHHLSAVLQFSNKAVMVFQMGDVIENQFKITAITVNAVYVYDSVNHVSRIVPFA